MKFTSCKIVSILMVATFLPLSFNVSARTDEEQDVKLNEHRLYINQNWTRSIDNAAAIATLNTSSGNHQNSINTLDYKINSLDDKFQALDAADIQGIDTRMSTFETSDANQDTRINENGDAIKSLETRVINNSDAVNNQGLRITDNNDAIMNLGIHVNNIQDGVNYQSTRITANDDAIETLDTRVTENKNDLIALGTENVIRDELIGTVQAMALKTHNWAAYADGYIYKNQQRSIANKGDIAGNRTDIDKNRSLVNIAGNRSIYNKNLLLTAVYEHNAIGHFLGVMPGPNSVTDNVLLHKNATEGNIYLGANSHVGFNLSEGDEGYDAALIKKDMTAVGAYSYAAADKSTSVGGKSNALGVGSGAFGYQSVATEDNTISFGNDYVAAIEAVEAVEYQAEIPFQEAVIVDGETWYEEIPYQAEILAVEAVEGRAEILENNRRLVHVAAGVNPTDAVNMTQHDALASYTGELHNYINVVDSQGVKNRKNLAITTRDVDATSIYLGILPDDGLSDSRETIIEHAKNENIHLGVGAQVGDNLYPDDVNYDPNNLKTGMTSLGGYARADGDQSTAVGSNSKALGSNSVSVGANSRAVEDNTVSFGNDFQAATEAQPAHEGNVALPARAAIAANTRRLTHISKGINATDAVNMEQYNSLSNTVDENRDEARSGIAISMATEVVPPAPGKKFSLTITVAEYEGTSAMGVTGSGRLNDSTTLFLGLGMDSNKDHSAAKVGANFQW